MRATGYSDISGSDMAAARERALDAALRAAVETASVRAFGAGRVGADPAGFRERVLDQARDYVNGYQVLTEGVEDGGGGSMRYGVVLEADVALSWVEEVLEPPPALPPGVSESALDPVVPLSRPPAPAPDTGRAVDLQLGGELTGARYRSLVEFLETEVPGVSSVVPVELTGGSLTLRVRGSFPAEDLGGYLASANLPGFSLRLSAAPRASPLEPERLLVRVEAGREVWR